MMMHDDSSNDRSWYPAQLAQLLEPLASLFTANRWKISTAESCTGGMLAAAITQVPGSSAWFDQGVVTYSNNAKSTMLDVDTSILESHGAVSDACVAAMAVGALRRSGANVAVSVSGIAGPDGSTPGKPVGTVWIGWAFRTTPLGGNARPGSQSGGALHDPEIDVITELRHWEGDRQAVREQAVLHALRGTIDKARVRV